MIKNWQQLAAALLLLHYVNKQRKSLIDITLHAAAAVS